MSDDDDEMDIDTATELHNKARLIPQQQPSRIKPRTIRKTCLQRTQSQSKIKTPPVVIQGVITVVNALRTMLRVHGVNNTYFKFTKTSTLVFTYSENRYNTRS